MNVTKEREQFEQEFSQTHCFARTDRGVYIDEGTRSAWRAWRRRALIAEEDQEREAVV